MVHQQILYVLVTVSISLTMDFFSNKRTGNDLPTVALSNMTSDRETC